MLRKISLLVGLACCIASATNYITADIVKGHSWTYLSSLYSSLAYKDFTKFINIRIDSIWGAAADTLFFQITEADSDSTTSQKTKEKVLCKEYNDTITCSSDSNFSQQLITMVFGYYALIQHDDSSNNGVYSHSRIQTIIANNRPLKSVKNWSGYYAGMYSSSTSTLAADTVGLLAYSYYSQGGLSASDYAYQLLNYCGNDFVYTIDSSSVKGNKSPFSRSHNTARPNSLSYQKELGRQTVPGAFSLLGREVPGRNCGYGIWIQRNDIRDK